MTTHRAPCRCGALTAVAAGEPVRISVCHCLDCQRRSGSAFSAQVRFASSDVVVTGPYSLWRTTGESGRWAEFYFCPTCGGQTAYQIENFPDVTAIPLGMFDDPHVFTPRHSVWECRKHEWLTLISAIEYHD